MRYDAMLERDAEALRLEEEEEERARLAAMPPPQQTPEEAALAAYQAAFGWAGRSDLHRPHRRRRRRGQGQGRRRLGQRAGRQQAGADFFNVLINV